MRRPRVLLRDAISDVGQSVRPAWVLFACGFRARYRRSWLGYAWLVLPAVVSALVAVMIQARGILSLPDVGMPYAIFVLSGVALWQVFVEAIGAPLAQLRSGKQLLSRTKLPGEALVLAGALEVLTNGAVRLMLLIIANAIAGQPLHLVLLLTPAVAIGVALVGFALGLLIAPLGLLYDDVAQALTIALGLGFFVTPVVYPLGSDLLFRWNPLVGLFEAERALIRGNIVLGTGTLLSLGVAAMLVVLAWLLFRVARPHLTARIQ